MKADSQQETQYFLSILCNHMQITDYIFFSPHKHTETDRSFRYMSYVDKQLFNCTSNKGEFGKHRPQEANSKRHIRWYCGLTDLNKE